MQMEDLILKHKNEVKQLLAKTQSMKHAVPKGDKKRKKQVQTEIAILESELEQRHAKELSELEAMESCSERLTSLSESVQEISLNEKNDSSKVRVSKAQRRRERKLDEERERQGIIEQAEIENVHSLRNVEAESISRKLSEYGLEIKEISADGNCLYNAIADQLLTRGSEHSWKSLRSMAANQLRNNKTDFHPFMTHPSTGDPYTDVVESNFTVHQLQMKTKCQQCWLCGSEDEFYRYCDDIEGTSAWGGHLEIQALSQVLKMPVDIYQASCPLVKIGEHFKDDPIRLSYHRHAYGLGEHYNSVVLKINGS